MAITAAAKAAILTINGGSSSIKFSFYKAGDEDGVLGRGEIENIGTAKAFFHYTDVVTGSKESVAISEKNGDSSTTFFIQWLEKNYSSGCIAAIGHRVVHGMHHTKPEIITPELITSLRQIAAIDPDHLPGEISLITLFSKHFPAHLQVACFDTSFHSSMPAVAKLLAVPARFTAAGLHRYGFHGLSYAWMLQELNRRMGADVANGKLVLAHLGSGASLAAVKHGKSIDTSMGFTPAAGLPMGTRSGDLDPGVAGYMLEKERLSPSQFNRLINHESGLLGISGTSADMRELLTAEASDQRAAAAVDFFCYQVKKWIGAYAAALEGVDVLAFSGGIGQHAPVIRQRICTGLGFLGIAIDEDSNNKNAPVISSGKSRVSIHVIEANEEWMIAQQTAQVLKEYK